jgi:penicillin amidase
MKFKLLIIIPSILFFSLYYIFYPKYDGQHLHNNPNYGTIHIKRDQNGIPHIKAKNVKDACFG